jgi:serine/threonine-protein kinase
LQPAAAILPQPSFAPVERDADLENPFARSSANTVAWLQAVAAIVGLFGAVLFGRVVLDAGKGTPANRPVMNAPQSPPAAAPVEVPSISATRAEPLPPTAASTEPRPQPAAVEAEASRKQRGKHGGRTARRPADDASSGVPEPARRSSSASPERRERSTAASATLRINSRPWSQVFIDGRAVGNTPQLGISLEPGTHSVRLVNPEFSMIKTFKLTVHAGENVTRVETLEE